MSALSDRLNVVTGNGRPIVIAWFDDFDGPHDFAALSNFYEGEPIAIKAWGDTFKTGEHAFAAMKAYDEYGKTVSYMQIRDANGPGGAKALGRVCRLRDDWEEVKYDVMMTVLRHKFTLDREEGKVLLQTGDALLIEGTFWGDHVWGVALGENSEPLAEPGRNWLGTMLMARRAELRAETLFNVKAETGEYNGLFCIGDFFN